MGRRRELMGEVKGKGLERGECGKPSTRGQGTWGGLLECHCRDVVRKGKRRGSSGQE